MSKYPDDGAGYNYSAIDPRSQDEHRRNDKPVESYGTCPKCGKPHSEHINSQGVFCTAPTTQAAPDELDRLYTDLENTFMGFLRQDPRGITSASATVAAQNFEARINALLKSRESQLLDRVEAEVIGKNTHKAQRAYRIESADYVAVVEEQAVNKKLNAQRTALATLKKKGEAS